MTKYEIIRLIIFATIPITVGIIGFFLNKRIKSFEHMQWTNQKMISKKLEVYDELVPKINDILCYFTFIGSWKEFKPEEMIILKREVDKIVYVNSPLFKDEFLKKYNEFIDNCYSSYSGWGNDAKLKTNFLRRKEVNKEWVVSWEEYFVDEDKITKTEIVKKSYINFVTFFAKEISLGMNTDSINTGEIPKSMKSVN